MDIACIKSRASVNNRAHHRPSFASSANRAHHRPIARIIGQSRASVTVIRDRAHHLQLHKNARTAHIIFSCTKMRASLSPNFSCTKMRASLSPNFSCTKMRASLSLVFDHTKIGIKIICGYSKKYLK